MQNIAETRERLDALIAAFTAAEYLVETEAGPIAFRLGRTTPALDRVLHGRRWAVITAHNPDGRLQSRRHNAAAHGRLRQALERLAPATCVPACNRDPAGDWPDEPGWLFTPAEITEVDRLARRFGQRATVAGGAGRPAELRVYGAGGTRLPDFARSVRS